MLVDLPCSAGAIGGRKVENFKSNGCAWRARKLGGEAHWGGDLRAREKVRERAGGTKRQEWTAGLIVCCMCVYNKIKYKQNFHLNNNILTKTIHPLIDPHNCRWWSMSLAGRGKQITRLSTLPSPFSLHRATEECRGAVAPALGRPRPVVERVKEARGLVM